MGGGECADEQRTQVPIYHGNKSVDATFHQQIKKSHYTHTVYTYGDKYQGKGMRIYLVLENIY